MKKLFLLFCTIFAAQLASAYDACIDDINYNLRDWYGNLHAEVTYKTTNYNSYSGDVIIPETIVYNRKTYPVTIIDDSAFRDCTDLSSITIPKSVKGVWNGAFYGCPNLKTVIFNGNLSDWCDLDLSRAGLLSQCTDLYINGEKIVDLVIPEGVTSIGNATFRGYSSLKSVTIPKSVTTIGISAFSGCKNLKSVYISDLSSWCRISFKGSPRSDANPLGNSADLYLNGEKVINLVVPDGVTTICDYSFSGCASIKNIIIPTSVTSIGFGAFYGCTNLTSVTIPASVISIKECAFVNCKNLKSVYISDLSVWCKITFAGSSANPLSNGADFYLNGEKVINLVVPDGVTTICDYSFSGCASIKNIIIPTSVTSIGFGAFSGCTSLTSINIPSSVKTIGYAAFKGCTGLTSITIPTSVTSIDDDTFFGCTGLTNITIPTSVTAIGSFAFSGCTSLTSVIIPESVTSIGDCAFYDCTGLTSVTIPSSVTYIAYEVFRGCTGLTSVNIPESVTSIGDYAFCDCTGLTSVNIPESVTSIGDRAFSGCTGLTSATIPASVTSIGDCAFTGCTGLTSATIPASVTSVGERAFSDCTGLTSATIPASVTSVGERAFIFCMGLKTVRVEAQTIGAEAFYGCDNATDLCINSKEIGTKAFSWMTSLKNVYSLTSTPPVATDDAFSNYSGVTLFVPVGSVERYKNATCWRNFLNIQTSDFSNLDAIFGSNSSNGIEEIKIDNECKVYASGHSISVEADSDDTVEIYTLQGTAIYRGTGSVTRDVQGGVYIVRVNNHTTKLMVR